MFYYQSKVGDLAVSDSFPLSLKCNGKAGRPSVFIDKEVIEELRGLSFTWSWDAKMFGVSRSTIIRRVNEYGLEHLQRFSEISDDQIDQIIREYILCHGPSTREPLLSGYFRSKGLFVQMHRIRTAINRVDPRNSALRWGALVSRRHYFVPWPNSLWHMDGHHSLIRWKFAIHVCCDGKSRKIMFLKCNTNNRAETVLGLFLNAINENGGFWP